MLGDFINGRRGRAEDFNTMILLTGPYMVLLDRRW